MASYASPSFMLLLLLQLWSCSEALPGGHLVDPTCPREWPSAAATSSDYNEPSCQPPAPHIPVAVFPYDVDPMQFALNLEYTEAEFFLHAAYGVGLDEIAPKLALGGPLPMGARKANLDEVTWRIVAEFGLQEVGHVRAIQRTVGGIPRPLIDLGAHNFARIMDAAFGYRLNPPFDPYINSLNFLLASYVVPYLGLNGYVGTNPIIDGYETKKLLAGLLGVEAGQDAVFRGLLFERLGEVVPPYGNITVAEFTDRVSALRNRLGRCGVMDEGLTVPRELGAEGAICTNVLSADRDSLSYARTPAELLRALYLTGDEHMPGGFYPEGANGRIARSFLGK
ncbi:desiccation-related protein PCC13-62-like [Panicum virgatum]|uniref:Desiccation-related protein PCC13-62 n=1 Tax=Panicum virgatum TaxID=38727 RepID=A0A8T0N0T2_PANVG|nr:desiccation-related protein PCC13-62-like [Panicum virgatum]KAG2540834.1 hypothetical protein PVAP13_9NG584200 [Panicum virgatum]